MTRMENILSRSENEENLAAYYVNFIVETVGNQFGTNETIFIRSGKKDRAIKVTKDL